MKVSPLYVKTTNKKGRGVFASRAIKSGSVIEECELIFFPRKELPYLKKTLIDCYYYCWKGAAVLPLGFGSLYNHSYHPNAEWKDEYSKRTMVLTALRPIKKGEEITVNYHLKPEELWFPVIEDKHDKKSKKKPS